MDAHKSLKLKIEPLTSSDRGWLVDHLNLHWGDTRMVIRGRLVDLTQQQGYFARLGQRTVGLITFRIENGSCEITSLDSQHEGIGVGTALISAVRQAAQDAGCYRLWLITTNDNLHALRFYQKRGFTIAAIHAAAVDRVSRPMKPGIPLHGHHGIPIRDEIELEMTLSAQFPAVESPPDFPRRLTRQILYECPWLTLYKDRVQLPDGRILPDYHVVEFLHAVGVLVENENGDLLFEQVYRYPTGRLEWEIPAGAIDPGEDPLLTAQREVYEETGYETYNHRLLFTYFPNDGNSNQRYYLVHCLAGEQTGTLDLGEIKTCSWLSQQEIMNLLNKGELMDGLSLTGILLLAQNKV